MIIIYFFSLLDLWLLQVKTVKSKACVKGKLGTDSSPCLPKEEVAGCRTVFIHVSTCNGHVCMSIYAHACMHTYPCVCLSLISLSIVRLARWDKISAYWLRAICQKVDRQGEAMKSLTWREITRGQCINGPFSAGGT